MASGGADRGYGLLHSLNNFTSLWFGNRGDEPHSSRFLDFATISSPLVRGTLNKLLRGFLSAIIRKNQVTALRYEDSSLEVQSPAKIHPSP